MRAPPVTPTPTSRQCTISKQGPRTPSTSPGTPPTRSISASPLQAKKVPRNARSTPSPIKRHDAITNNEPGDSEKRQCVEKTELAFVHKAPIKPNPQKPVTGIRPLLETSMTGVAPKTPAKPNVNTVVQLFCLEVIWEWFPECKPQHF
ncbi:uncharacterized protein PGTG_09745 [Puccinia graminis f. sp. tritici CRL 75-36-700-3]|uniref:Uncharacterized protein n=1 Tax=Puccinia graminis f. sp. tritici (strain CRL 75-36-700-3 / race SCCL) TaxID=418459 RepID=E3KIA7_PUCGT|nr:uncharacterized protein PGTG_09745 [Puccinia graminis f. sp. tritici CRL 75-36-700-3]EFP84032.2 hypothetical protein PGTG_09745 [Puccinia graminis f. sp. tritici CRL 75-36-700-3]